jgi:polysaccharide pyruvyl transferase WcaK-like protein
MSQIWKNDFMILGGGGLLQNKTSPRSLLYYLGLVGLARILQSPVVLYAMGVETINGKFSQWLTKMILTSPSVTITVRDAASKEILMGLGVPVASIHLTADPVFSRRPQQVPRERYAMTSTGSALLIPRFPCPPAGRTLFAIPARILRDEKKMKVKGLLFEPKTELPFLQQYSGHPILSEDDFFPGLSLDDMTQRVGEFDWIVSARFHGLVLAALAGKPFIGVGDPHKVGRICDFLKMPFLPWDADEVAIERAIETIARKNTPVPSHMVEQLCEAALQTANHLR